MGQLLFFLGIVAIYIASQYDVTLPNEEFQKIQKLMGNTSAPTELKTVNLQRMQFQILFYVSGVASCLSGVITMVGSSIVASLSSIYHADRPE